MAAEIHTRLCEKKGMEYKGINAKDEKDEKESTHRSMCVGFFTIIDNRKNCLNAEHTFITHHRHIYIIGGYNTRR